MIGILVSFFAGPLGKLVGIGLSILAAGGLIWLLIHNYNEGIRRDATANWNKIQLETVLAEQKKLHDLQLDIQSSQRKLILDLDMQNKELSKKYSNLVQFLNSADVLKQDKPISPLLKEGLRKLQEIE